MKLKKIKDIAIGSPFLYMNKAWVKTDIEVATTLFDDGFNFCSFDIEPTCVFVFPLCRQRMLDFLSGKKNIDFLDEEDKEVLKMADLLEQYARNEKIIDFDWLKENKERLCFFNDFKKDIIKNNLIDEYEFEFDEERIQLAIIFIKNWYNKKKEDEK